MTKKVVRGSRPVPSPDPYRATLESLYRRRRFGLRPGLEVEQALLAELGHPERRFPALHVTGSKGKGSVAAMAAAILTAHGISTGRFTSPHLVSYRERIRLDGAEISPEEVIEGVERVESAGADLVDRHEVDRAPTFFEVTTALALDWFARRNAAAAVVEVGIGGRLDATNVLDGRVGVVTTIELEHTDLLGPTVEAIAEEKSGILHAGMLGVVGELPTGARDRILRAADRLGVPVWSLGEEILVEGRELTPDGQSFSVRLPGGLAFDRLRIPLHGRFQVGNAALAVAATARFLSAIDHPLEPEAVRRGLSSVEWPGRLQRVERDPELFFDVAHTPGSARAVAEAIAEIAPFLDPAESAIVYGSLRGKDVSKILDALSPLARTLVIVPVASERGLPPSEVRAAAIGRFPRVVIAPGPSEGVRLARAATGTDGITLVVGSDYLIGELARLSEPNDEPDLSDPGVGGPTGAPAEPAPPTPRRMKAS